MAFKLQFKSILMSLGIVLRFTPSCFFDIVKYEHHIMNGNSVLSCPVLLGVLFWSGLVWSGLFCTYTILFNTIQAPMLLQMQLLQFGLPA